MDADDLRREVGGIDKLGRRMRRLIEASDFGPNTREVVAFLERLDAFTWDDWRALQRAYVDSLKLKVTPSLKTLEAAAAGAGLSDQIMAAGWAAADKFPVAAAGRGMIDRLLSPEVQAELEATDRLGEMPDDIDMRLCQTACNIAGGAVAGRSLVSEPDFELMFLPFTRMTPRVATRRAGCASAAVLVAVFTAAPVLIVQLH